MRGGLAQTSVVLSTLMGGVSGSATADAAMEARLLGPDMIKSGYSKGFSANVLTFTSLITATIPPGVGLIIYGTTGSVSIGKLFSAGIFVGLYMMIVLDNQKGSKKCGGKFIIMRDNKGYAAFSGLLYNRLPDKLHISASSPLVGSSK